MGPQILNMPCWGEPCGYYGSSGHENLWDSCLLKATGEMWLGRWCFLSIPMFFFQKMAFSIGYDLILYAICYWKRCKCKLQCTKNLEFWTFGFKLDLCLLRWPSQHRFIPCFLLSITNQHQHPSIFFLRCCKAMKQILSSAPHRVPQKALLLDESAQNTIEPRAKLIRYMRWLWTGDILTNLGP